MRPALPELSGQELIAEWRKVIDAAVGSLSSVGEHVEAPHQLVDPMRRQLELVEELIARERRLQRQAASQLLAPVDAVFELLEASTRTLRKQGEALEAAGRALEETAGLVKAQAALFEGAVGTLREPSDRARAAIGLEPRARRKAPARSRRRS